MIVCCGEALIDMIPMQGAEGESGYAPLCGGALYNTAIALGRLGVNTGMISGISSDLFGQQLVAGLQASKVNTDLVVRSKLPTTLAFIQLTNGQAGYTFYDENTAGRSLSVTDIPTVPEHVSTLYFGGISLISEPGADSYCALAEREYKQRVVVLDPNIRTSFIEDEAGYRRRLGRMMAIADIIKVSDEDLDWLVFGSQSEADKAEALRSSATHIVVVTKGKDGSTAYFADGSHVSASVPEVTVVDTVGAGDTFNAGFMAKLAELGVLSKAALTSIDAAATSEALVYGAKVAAVTVSRAGANPPWATEIQ